MNLLEVSLYISNISYETNELLKNILMDDTYDLHGLDNNYFNYRTIKFLTDNKNKLTVSINEKTDIVLPNICFSIYNNDLLIAFSGIRNSNDTKCCLDFLLKYDAEFGCYIHNGMLKLFCGIKDELKLILDINKEKNYRIIFIGHSLGASIAKLAAVYFNKIENINCYCITFSSPMVGNQSFSDVFDIYVKNTINFSFPCDFIVNIPLTRSCNEIKCHMVDDNIIVPYKLTSKKYIWNLIKYNYDTHRLLYFYEKLITNEPDLSVFNKFNIK